MRFLASVGKLDQREVARGVDPKAEQKVALRVQLAETAANRDAFLNMQENLRENGLDPDQVPLVIQFNKRDMPNVRTDSELDRMAERGKEPVYKAVALRGVGVLETLLGLLEHTFAHLDRLHSLEGKFGLRQADFMAEVRARLESGRS